MSPISRPARRLRRRSLALVALVGCLSVGLSTTGATVQAELPTPPPGNFMPSTPPPVPEFWYTGSEADNIPGGGTVVLFTHPDVVLAHPYNWGVFHLTGPKPLQTKHSVACGDLGCVYNHLDWTVDAERVSGCATNTSTCDVKVAPGGAGWAAVMVRQNTEPPLIFLLWNSLVPGGTISGTVTDSTGAGVPGVDVNGATTDYAGFYTMDVAAGTYTVSASGRGGPYEPASTRVRVPPNGAAEADFSTKSYEVGGQVLGLSCNGTSCPPPFGLAGQGILVQGRSSTGKAVSEMAVSKADGKWSAKVPAGTYNLGPTVDGKTMDLPVFDPEEIPGVVVHGHDVWGNDFEACAAGGGSSGAQERPLRAAALASAGPARPSVCQSVYTVVVSAALASEDLVDPSKDALFNTNTNPKGAGVLQSPHYSTLRRWLRLAPEFPGCQSEYSNLVTLSRQGAQFQWFSYYYPDTATLGQIQFPLVWKWSGKTKTVDYAGTPTVAYGKITKLWTYEYTLPGQPGVVHRNSCWDTRTVRMTTVLAAGGNGGAAGLKPNQFTIEIAWWLPFDPEGVAVDTEGSLGDQTAEYGATLLQKLAAAGSKAAAAVYEKYEAMPMWQKFALGLACGIAAEGLAIKGAVAAPELIAKLMGTELPEGTAAFMEHVIGSDLELAHYLMTAAEIAGFYVGTIKGYPVMSAVIRGSFSGTPCAVGSTVECKSTLALAVSPTQFPDISVKVVRAVDTSYGRSGIHGPLYTGALPWKTAYSSRGSEVSTFNPAFGSNPSYLVSNIGNGAKYASGAQAVANVQAGTAQNPQLVQSVRQTLSPAKQFVAAQEALNDPECDKYGEPESHSTICWVLKDGRP